MAPHSGHKRSSEPPGRSEYARAKRTALSPDSEGMDRMHIDDLHGSAAQRAPSVEHPTRSSSTGSLFGMEAGLHRYDGAAASSDTTDASRGPVESPERCPENSADASFICFGTITNVKIQLRHDPRGAYPERTTNPSAMEGYATLKLSFDINHCWVHAPDGEPIGLVSARAFKPLNELSHITCMQLEPIARVAALKESWGGWRTFGTSPTTMVDINVYGHQHSSQAVAKYLNASRIFLQPPVADQRHLPYDNPQYLKLPTASRIEEK